MSERVATPRRPVLLPLVPVYRAAIAAKNAYFDRHRNGRRELRDPVASVGSLSAGGAGKTPFVAALVGLLREIGYAPDVLSRGYGRTSRAVMRVAPYGDAAAFGDEPLLLAQTLGCPVYVGADRYAAGVLAEEELPDFHRGIHVLDDGFGHRRLPRTIDLVLLTLQDARDTLLPAGNLREPFRSLRRADVVVLRVNEADELRPQLARWGVPASTAVWLIERELTLPAQLPARPLVFCGIARPADFEAMLSARGIASAGTLRFPDHYRYGPAALPLLLRKAQASAADGWITTAKDAVKLTEAMREAMAAVGPIAVADAVVHLRERERCADDLRRLLLARNGLARGIVASRLASVARTGRKR